MKNLLLCCDVLSQNKIVIECGYSLVSPGDIVEYFDDGDRPHYAYVIHNWSGLLSDDLAAIIRLAGETQTAVRVYSHQWEAES